MRVIHFHNSFDAQVPHKDHKKQVHLFPGPLSLNILRNNLRVQAISKWNNEFKWKKIVRADNTNTNSS